jgi:lipoprotein-anchoring transpeptidase ErfK/SrfK
VAVLDADSEHDPAGAASLFAVRRRDGGWSRQSAGARALYLYRGGADSMLRIHGTPQPWSIGTSASSGCVRLVNDHVMQLYENVPLGTRAILHSPWS